MNKQDMVYTYNRDFFGPKKKVVMSYARKWMKLEIIILSQSYLEK